MKITKKLNVLKSYDSPTTKLNVLKSTDSLRDNEVPGTSFKTHSLSIEFEAANLKDSKNTVIPIKRIIRRDDFNKTRYIKFFPYKHSRNSNYDQAVAKVILQY